MKRGRAGALAFGVVFDKPKPNETMEEKGENQRGLKKRDGEVDSGGKEVQAIFTAIEVDAEQVATPSEKEYDNGGGDGAVI